VAVERIWDGHVLRKDDEKERKETTKSTRCKAEMYPKESARYGRQCKQKIEIRMKTGCRTCRDMDSVLAPHVPGIYAVIKEAKRSPTEDGR